MRMNGVQLHAMIQVNLISITFKYKKEVKKENAMFYESIYLKHRIGSN